MADPVPTACPVDTWTKVATNQTSGMVYILKKTALYFFTYRDTGGDAPTDLSEAVSMQMPGAKISAPAGIDVYIYCKREAGEVRVDLP